VWVGYERQEANRIFSQQGSSKDLSLSLALTATHEALLQPMNGR
jgi:hypothetical protein